MDNLQYLIDLHKTGQRQGPGSQEETKKAIALAMVDQTQPLKIADMGCGTGASTMTLATELNAQIIAVDFLPEFLDILKKNIQSKGLTDKITPLACSMDDLPFAKEALDVIWSEGAIYNMGFKAGITYWKQFLKTGGILAVSEITWLTDKRPFALQSYWDKAYPEIDTASAKIAILEQNGYLPMGYFFLPKHCWLEHYYKPMQKRFPIFLRQYNQSKEAQAVIDAEKQEIALYERYHSYFSYGFYIAKKL